MTIKFTPLLFSLLFTSALSAQDVAQVDFKPIENQLMAWDQVRGEWLSKSMLAIANKQEIPDRTFPEAFTPFEMMTLLPVQTKEAIRTTVQREEQAGRTTPNTPQHNVWMSMVDFMGRPNCQTSSGRSYGDPHFTSFDGNAYSLQTVGEFVLAKSKNGSLEVQSRQKASSNDVSLNTAVAMNVGGDRFCIYAADLPDSDISTPLRLNGRPVHVEDNVFFLPHGGTVRHKGKEYTITWPTGEKVLVQMRSSGHFNFMNITTIIYPCTMGGYEGLMGNANGLPNDDLDVMNRKNNDLFESMSRYSSVFGPTPTAQGGNSAEKQYLERLTREFGAHWRISETNSLFDYGYGQTTLSFTDLKFPSNYRTIDDLDPAQRAAAQRICEANEITGNALRGCIYDNGFLNIPPTPRPVVADPTSNVVLARIPVEEARPNVNKPYVAPVKKEDAQIGSPVLSSPNTQEKVENAAPSKKPIEAPKPTKETGEVKKPEPYYPPSTPMPKKTTIGDVIFGENSKQPSKTGNPTPSPKVETKALPKPVASPSTKPVETIKTPSTSSPVSKPTSTSSSPSLPAPTKNPEVKKTSPSVGSGTSKVAVPIKKGGL